MPSPYTAQLADLSLFSQTFPQLPNPLIPRDSILTAIDTSFRHTETVAVEGEPGVGKSVTLAQFVKRHPDKAFSLFVTTNSKWGYDPDILRADLYTQIYCTVHSTALPPDTDVTTSQYFEIISQLLRKAKRTQSVYYFIVDGLHDIPHTAGQYREAILGLMPFGMNAFRFLFTKPPNEELPSSIHSPYKAFILPPFGRDETKAYLSDITGDIGIVDEIFNTTKGYPGHLASVRRLVAAGTDIATLSATLPDQLPALFEIEWQRAEPLGDKQRLLLGIVAFDQRRHTIHTISRLTKLGSAEVDTFVNARPFLTTGDSIGIGFVSDSFRAFAAKQLAGLRTQVYELLISDFMSSPDDSASSDYLPTLFDKAGKLV